MKRCFCSALIAGTLLLPFAAQTQSYSVTDLGGVNGIGLAISSGGNVAGLSDGSFGFFWSLNRGLLKLPALPGGNSSVANGINAAGLIVGESTVNLDGVNHAVIWTNGKIQDIGTLTADGQSWANAINATGQVVGAANPADSNPHAFLWTRTNGMQDLGTLPGGSYCQALAINRFGQVVGYSDVANGVTFGFVWSKSTGMQNLGSLSGGGGSSANAINDLGQIAGGSGCGAACFHSVLWSKTAGSIQDLGLVAGSEFQFRSPASTVIIRGRLWAGRDFRLARIMPLSGVRRRVRRISTI